MSDPEQPGGASNQYRNIQVNEGAKAHLGNTYYISQLLEVQRRLLPQTDTRQAEKTPSASSRLQHRRRLIPATGNTNLPASMTRASTFYKRYMTGLMEQTDKMSDASSG
jgi:hypothetical protein